MQSIIEKYEAILKKPVPEPFREYIEELLAAVKSSGTIRSTRKIGKALPEIDGDEA